MKQIINFLIVGTVATIIDFIIYYILYNIFSINPLIANIISFTISVIFNYIASIRWVFKVDENKNKKIIFTTFIILSIVGMLITELLIFIFVDMINIEPMISKIIATIITMIFNFISRKLILEK